MMQQNAAAIMLSGVKVRIPHSLVKYRLSRDTSSMRYHAGMRTQWACLSMPYVHVHVHHVMCSPFLLSFAIRTAFFLCH